MPQSFSQIYLHVVFSTKDRSPVLADDWRSDVFGILGHAVKKTGCQTLIVGGVSDHVHLLLRLTRIITTAELVSRIKTGSTTWINETNKLPYDFHWQAGYAAFSVDYTRVDTIREYIVKQPEHHADLSFQDEMRAELTRHGLTWDEKYAWE